MSSSSSKRRGWGRRPWIAAYPADRTRAGISRSGSRARAAGARPRPRRRAARRRGRTRRCVAGDHELAHLVAQPRRRSPGAVSRAARPRRRPGLSPRASRGRWRRSAAGGSRRRARAGATPPPAPGAAAGRVLVDRQRRRARSGRRRGLRLASVTIDTSAAMITTTTITMPNASCTAGLSRAVAPSAARAAARRVASCDCRRSIGSLQTRSDVAGGRSAARVVPRHAPESVRATYCRCPGRAIPFRFVD